MTDFKVIKTDFSIIVPALLCMGLGTFSIISWNLMFHELIYEAVSLYLAVAASALVLLALFFAKFRIVIMRLSSSVSFTGLIYILGVILGIYATIRGWNWYTKRYLYACNLYVPLWLLASSLPLIFRIAFTSSTKRTFSRWMLFCIPPVLLFSLLGDFPTLLLFILMIAPVAVLAGNKTSYILITILITVIAIVFLLSGPGKQVYQEYLLKKQQYHHNIQNRLAPENVKYLTRQYANLVHLLKRDSTVSIYSRYGGVGLALLSSVYMLLVAAIVAQGFRNRSSPQVLAVHCSVAIFFFVPMVMGLVNTLCKPIFPSLFIPMIGLDWNPVAVSGVFLAIMSGWRQIACNRIHYGNGVVNVAGKVKFTIVPNFLLKIDLTAATTESTDRLCTIIPKNDRSLKGTIT